MNLREIIEATLIELDRGTEADTVAMYAKKFTMYANEAVEEIARRFKVCTLNFTELGSFSEHISWCKFAPRTWVKK